MLMEVFNYLLDGVNSTSFSHLKLLSHALSITSERLTSLDEATMVKYLDKNNKILFLNYHYSN